MEAEINGDNVVIAGKVKGVIRVTKMLTMLPTAVMTGDIYTPNVDCTEALRRETGHFLDCIRERRTPESDGPAGLRIVKILAAAQESLAANGSWIAL